MPQIKLLYPLDNSNYLFSVSSSFFFLLEVHRSEQPLIYFNCGCVTPTDKIRCFVSVDGQHLVDLPGVNSGGKWISTLDSSL